MDAVRWVLGENNVRNLRGSKGSGIFCGTDSKRAHGMAAVEMLIDMLMALFPQYREINLAASCFARGKQFTINRPGAQGYTTYLRNRFGQEGLCHNQSGVNWSSS